ncbi:MAG: heme-binding protein [Phycisphaerales bacterium]|nr:MAG: heme-binding protein [Phycisphaerales bacterium]
MNLTKLLLIIGLLAVPALLCSCGLIGLRGIERAKYTVVTKQGAFEIRQYAPQIVAETVVKADFDEAGNVAFRRLYGYISGQNRAKKSIAMTAPVEQASSEKIAMTAPVEQVETGGQYTVNFLMPAQYTMETLPQPLDPEVTLREIPARKMAALRYSGTWSQKRYARKQEALEQFIVEQGLDVTGEAVFARYDPPFQLWFLRRNEVLIPVE